MQLLQDWGWQENAYREFAPPNGVPLSPSELDYARVGIHRFGGVSQSAAAADYIAQDVVAGIGGGGGPGPDIGDGSILLSGQNENGNWVNLIVYQGPYVISISMSSPQGDPSGPALAMAQAVLANEGLSSAAWDGGQGDTNQQVASAAIIASRAFGAEDWQGGLYRGDGEWYGRPWVAVYGAQSSYPVAAFTFSLDTPPTGDATLALTGLDDEFPANTRIRVAINDVSIHAGPSPFANWDGNMANQGADAAWAQAAYAIPAGLLLPGVNELTVANLEPTANVGEPPWVLVGDAVLSFG